mgnify:CR=1 FL=1
MGKRSRQRNRNLGIEKPCSPPRSQGSNVNTRILTTPSIIQDLSKNQVYDAGDVAKGYACAHAELLDFAAMLTAIDNENENLIELLQKVHSIPAHIFRDLRRIIGSTGRLLDQSLEFIENQENEYKNLS